MSVEEQSDSRPEPPGMVLVLDDDDLMRGAMRRILEARGHTVATAETAADAIEFCEASNAAGVAGWISLVIADVGAAGAEFGTRPGPDSPSCTSAGSAARWPKTVVSSAPATCSSQSRSVPPRSTRRSARRSIDRRRPPRSIDRCRTATLNR